MRGARGFVIAAAVVAVVVAAFYLAPRRGRRRPAVGLDDDRPRRHDDRPRRPTGAVKVVLAYSPEKDEMLQTLIAEYNDEEHEVGGREVFVEGAELVVGRGRAADRRGHVQADGLVAVVEPLGAAPQLPGRQALRRRHEPVARADAARDRDVGVRGEGARLAAQADLLDADPADGDLERGLGAVRPADLRRVPARAHEPGLLDLRALGGRRASTTPSPASRGPRRRTSQQEGARARCGRSSSRSSTTATRRSSSPTS